MISVQIFFPIRLLIKSYGISMLLNRIMGPLIGEVFNNLLIVPQIVSQYMSLSYKKDSLLHENLNM